MKDDPLLIEPEILVEAKLRELESLETERARRRRYSGMSYYVPNHMQLKAHRSNARTIIFSGGNRTGKTTFGAMELCFHLTKDYPAYFSPVRRFRGPVRAVVSVDSFDKIAKVIEPKLKQYLPQGSFKVRRKVSSYLSRIEYKDGSTVDVLTLEMDDLQYEGFDADFVWEDEPQNRSKRQGLLRALIDRRGYEVITFTPLTEPWMKEELVDKADGKRIDLITVDMRDNRFTVAGEPILREEAIREFEASIPEDVRETRVHGKFFHLRGLVYKEFSSVHTSDFAYTYPDPVICVLDPHDRVPHHVVWAYIDRQDDVYIDYEFTGHIELGELAKKILEIEARRGYKMKRRLIDPNFGRKPSRVGSNQTVIEELSRQGAYFFEANDNIELGHMIVREYLHYDKSRDVTAVNKPKVFFSRERAPSTIRSVMNLQYDEWIGKRANERNPKEKQKEREDHGADCIRYLLVSRPTHGTLNASDTYELSKPPY